MHYLVGLVVYLFTSKLALILYREEIGEYLIEDLQVIEDLQKTYGRPTKMGDIYIKSDAILLIDIS